jgi:hypothetical protein
MGEARGPFVHSAVAEVLWNFPQVRYHGYQRRHRLSKLDSPLAELAMKVCMIASILFAGVLSQGLLAQDPLLMAPQKEHELLERFVGDWHTESEMTMGPDQPSMKCKGQIHAATLGKMWLVANVENNVMGTKMNAVLTLGYDPDKKKYVGTWIDSMVNHLWHYNGWLEDDGKTLILEAEGPNMMQPGTGKTAKFRDVYIFKSPDQMETKALMQQEDGKWITMATGTSQRKSAR